jgi:hypothetical protein
MQNGEHPTCRFSRSSINPAGSVHASPTGIAGCMHGLAVAGLPVLLVYPWQEDRHQLYCTVLPQSWLHATLPSYRVLAIKSTVRASPVAK